MPDKEYTITSKLIMLVMILEVICCIAIINWGDGPLVYINLAVMPMLIKYTNDKYNLYHISYADAVDILGIDFTDCHVTAYMAYVHRLKEINDYCVLNQKERDMLLAKVKEAYDCWKQYTHWPIETEEFLRETEKQNPSLGRNNKLLCGFKEKRMESCVTPTYIERQKCKMFSCAAKMEMKEEYVLFQERLKRYKEHPEDKS